MADFLTGRRHRVSCCGAPSDHDAVTCGVPQGTRLGVIVFLAKVNALCLNTGNRAKYVDDLRIAEIIRVRNEITFRAQGELHALRGECERSKEISSLAKCEVMLMCPKSTTSYTYTYV